MSGFDLVPVDGGDPIHLPPGETVLGRGPLLGISDTRVSRRHGLLENLNGELRLKPTHVNPCFVQSSLNDDPRPLEKGSHLRLHHGDLVSLLPGRFIYRVEAVGGEARTPRNSQNFEDEDELLVSAGPDVEAPPAVGQKQTSPPSAAQNEDKAKSYSFRRDDSTLRVDEGQSSIAPSATPAPPAPRRRVLPAWMMASVPKVQSAVKKSKQPVTTEATPTAASLPGEAELHGEAEEEKPRKKRMKMNNEEEKPPSETSDSQEVPPDESTVRCRSKTSRSDVSDEPDNINTKKTGSVSSQVTEISRSVQEDKSSKRPVRTPCPYGRDCYRKNPLHFQECSHPGDVDYKEEEEEEEEERPECPYGTDCYRKNPLHRKQFKHTKGPVPSTPDEDEEDSGDDDSFINDDSEDVGDDSDYVPPASGDSEQEDVQRLQREAEVFLKNTK